MNTPSTQPRRILVIDDNPAIHDDFRKILSPEALPSEQLRSAAAAVFGRPVQTEKPSLYEVDVVSRGQDGLDRVRQAVFEGRPYALAFVDMRMPNGWDGLETTKQIWQASPTL